MADFCGGNARSCKLFSSGPPNNFPGPSWEVTDPDGRALLRSELQPIRASAPADVPDHGSWLRHVVGVSDAMGLGN